MNINSLPIEIRRLIALQIRDRWERHDFIKAIGNGLEEYHYGNRYRHPLPKWTRTFIPITIFPKYEVTRDIDIDITTDITLELPIIEGKVHKIRYIFRRFGFSQSVDIRHLINYNKNQWLMWNFEDVGLYRKVGKMCWKEQPYDV